LTSWIKTGERVSRTQAQKLQRIASFRVLRERIKIISSRGLKQKFVRFNSKTEVVGIENLDQQRVWRLRCFP